MIDAENRLSHHIAIAVLSTLPVIIAMLFDFRVGRVVGGIPFVILFLVMIIGPIMTIWPSLTHKLPEKFPWNWRAELGIWFAVWSVAHVLLVFHRRDWDVIGYLTGISPWAFGALVATVMAIVLAALSFRGAIEYLGTQSWKWLQNYFTYVIWWLMVVHVIDRALLRPGFPSSDWAHWMYLIMVVAVPILQLLGFMKIVSRHRAQMHAEAEEAEAEEEKKKRNIKTKKRPTKKKSR